jgi:hypothetical protein
VVSPDAISTAPVRKGRPRMTGWEWVGAGTDPAIARQSEHGDASSTNYANLHEWCEKTSPKSA